MSTLKTGLLMLLIFVVLLGIGSFFGPGGMTTAFIFALALNGISYWFCDKIVLAMHHAHEVPPEQAPSLHAIIEELCHKAGLPKPRVYAIESPSPNAFATGRDPEHAVIAVTTGILRMLSESELRGVIAHELAHIHNRDILIQSVVATVSGTITYLAMMLRWAAIFGGGRRNDREGNPFALIIMAIIAPIVAMLIQMCISRTREYAADDAGARFAENPLGLANALKKLQAASERIPLHSNPATAHMFIVAPFTGKTFVSLFSTHPPIKERIARLQRMASQSQH